MDLGWGGGVGVGDGRVGSDLVLALTVEDDDLGDGPAHAENLGRQALRFLPAPHLPPSNPHTSKT